MPLRAQPPQPARPASPAGQSVTLLPDGSVLLIGGEQTRTAVAIRRPDGAVVAVKASPLTPRAWHTATVLSDGSVLLVGGVDDRGRTIASPERFVLSSETFEALPADGFAPRAHHTATLLTSGRVLIVGGAAATVRDDADIWDPVTEVARPLASTLELPRAGHTATLQADGSVRISGGVSSQSADEFFDPSTDAFQQRRSVSPEPRSLFVTAVTPAVRAVDVPLDTMITLRFSLPVDARTVSDAAIGVNGPDGVVAATVILAEGGRLLFARAAEPLQPKSMYRLTVEGLATPDRQPIALASFSFTTKDGDDPRRPREDDEAWASDGANGWRTGRGPSPWQTLPSLAAPPGVTAVAGQVLRLNGAPLPDVTLEIAGYAARTDRSGRFLLIAEGLSSGEHTLEIDSTTANRGNRTYGFYEARIKIRAGATTALPFTIWSPVLDTARAVTIASPTATETVVRTPAIPGLELHLPAGTVIRDEQGSLVRRLTMTPIPLDRTPFPLPSDATFTMFFTIQPGGAYIQTPGPVKGAWLVYPNHTTIRPGTKVQFFNYDPDDKGWYVYGVGTVTPTQVIPEPKTRIYAFTGASFNSGPTPPPSGATPGGPRTGDPVDPSTGAFIMEKTDFSLPDVMPLSLTRTYNSMDSQQRPFGIGMMHSYGHYQYTTNSFNDGDLILPDGGRIHYVRISASGLPWYQTVFECQAGPTAFYKSRLTFVNNNWEAALKDGTVFVIGHMGPLQAVRDRYGNETRLTWSDVNVFNAGVGNLIRVTSPNGRWVEFTYDSATPVNHVTQAKDNIGRTVAYTYDGSGRLQTATDPENNVTTYTWDSSNRMTSIEDGRGIVYLTNQYDTSNRVTQQTLADPGATYTFSYTTSAGNITQTDVTDPLGHVKRFAFNSDHYVTSTTEAYGTSLARTTTLTRQTSTNLVTAMVDGLNRRTEYTYDTSGHVLTETRLAGTSEAVATSFTYEPLFFQLETVTDPMSHIWTFAYDNNGRMTSLLDPRGHQSTFTLNSSGQVTQFTDPLQHSWQFAYATGDLVSTTNPLGDGETRFTDAAGRLVSTVDGLGRATRVTVDKLNRVTAIVNSAGGQTAFTYDANSNLMSVTDALSHATTFGRDSSDRISAMTDALTHAASYGYDRSDNLVEFTDRKGQVSNYDYDALNRLSVVTYDDQATVTYLYDSGDRITQIDDSANGTITREYDGLNRLTEESTPEGTVSYTYDEDGRRTTMTVAGQPTVSYDYDDDHQLTSITQGTANVSLAYDHAHRRSIVTLPNGITGTYTYDAANRLTEILYAVSQVTLGNLTYAYDAAGHRTAAGGSWARTNLPPALSTATYDAANRIATWGATTFSYDLNGNTTGDGMSTYSWNARDELVGLSGGVSAGFQYDGTGRRRGKTIASSSTRFLYDGLNIVQELTAAGAPAASLLTNLRLDEVFTRTDATSTVTFLNDALLSTVALTDDSGSIQASYSYGPFGETTVTGASSDRAAQFTGRENDSGGLYFYRSRFYATAVQRFVSEDPLGLRAGDANLYAYVSNSPLNATDPLGLIKLPADPTGLGPEWKADPSHLDPTGTRYRDPSGRPLDWHPGGEGEPGWGGKPHWHAPNNYGKRHLPPGTDVPDPAPLPEKGPKVPRIPFPIPWRLPFPFPLMINPCLNSFMRALLPDCNPMGMPRQCAG